MTCTAKSQERTGGRLGKNPSSAARFARQRRTKADVKTDHSFLFPADHSREKTPTPQGGVEGFERERLMAWVGLRYSQSLGRHD